MTVWLVTKVGVYDHGVYMVAETEQAALDFCREWAPDNDGWHSWEVRTMEVGAADISGCTPRANLSAKARAEAHVWLGEERVTI